MSETIQLGHVFIFTGVSGSGKSTLCMQLDKEGYGKFSISYTTRMKSEQEKDQMHYFFITKEEFEEKIMQDEFLEYAKVHDHYYGTCKKHLEGICQEGIHALLEIDVVGAKQVKDKLPDKVHSFFILPPSLEEVESRLHNRNREDGIEIQKRLRHGLDELQHLDEFDYLLINDDFERMYQETRLIIDAATKQENQEDANQFLTANRQDIVSKWRNLVNNKLKSLDG